MADKDSGEKSNRTLSRGNPWRSRWSRWTSRQPFSLLKHEGGYKFLLLLGVSLVIATILTPHPQKPLARYKLGDIAREDIRAVGDLLVEDVETTGQRQRELLAQVPPVYDLDEQVLGKVQERLRLAMDFIRQYYQEVIKPEPLPGSRTSRRREASPSFSIVYKHLLEQKPEFDRLLGCTIPTSTYHLLAKAEFSPQLEALINQVLSQFFHQGVISNRSILTPDAREILIRRLPSRREQVERPPYQFIEMEEVRKTAAGYCREVAGDFAPAERWLVCDLAQYLMVPNVSPNLAETQERRQERIRTFQSTYFKVKRGEFILREGEKITLVHLAKLQVHRESYPQGRGVLIFLGIFLSVALFLGMTYRLACLAFKQFSDRLRDLAFMTMLLFMSVLLNKGLLVLGENLSRIRPEVGQNLVYALPLGLWPIFAAMFLGLETGVGVAFLGASFAALLVDKPFPLFLYFVSSGLVGVWGVQDCRRRSALLKAGLAISLVNLVMVSTLKLLEYPFTLPDLAVAQLFGLGGGLVTGVLALGLTPVMEVGFRYSSNIRLLELLSLDQPVLRDLMLQAPGTYHHSMIVGQMVEAAAEAIGANPLITKAAAYYHDIGKIKKPLYFIENQRSGQNKHEKLAPSMSGLILISHVKDGVDLARRHKLGSRIADIIQQHHGTSLISYFFHKAKTQGPNPQQVNIDDYRYPGPRPQTKEAGLVLLADQVEAASKSLGDPTPARIQGLVQKIIYNIFADGQLDNCELTLRDLHLIAKSFNKVLGGIFHQRVDYPRPVDKKKAHEDLDKQPAKKNGVKPGEGQEKGREDLKRLGMG